jgi:hypothetical protein
LVNIQPINPIRLANRVSIHPKAMKYKRRVMCFLLPALQRFLLLLRHSAFRPVTAFDFVTVALSNSPSCEPDQRPTFWSSWAFCSKGQSDFGKRRKDGADRRGKPVPLIGPRGNPRPPASVYCSHKARRGRVTLRWQVTADPQTLIMAWTERHGPRIEQPAKEGTATLSYYEDGFVYRLEVPLSQLEVEGRDFRSGHTSSLQFLRQGSCHGDKQ